ncbi:CRR6 family NdhI maturation factor [Prochlorothrix hollandica]|uniref:DUF1817 domain-containing protein n=1 Tax=Prochlorothrix hollandica PCC 9006 = CALU 1027 TaxID=317619 RepID=A0A0M2Q386_PROHO|nr:CRR6 family NdhI maturation factor [Prochlorothrix hollandica]KKJ01409.1 hypothetical protein PROH_03470 [Prochlorothrix hollandica PCC 9006 = CALU 1027]
MALTISLDLSILESLDLTPAQQLLDPLVAQGTVLHQEQQISFTINYPREDGDPRELSEIPEIRLWFVRLDARYPWLPLLLDWKAGELARYMAMVVPHQFHPMEGIQYNPEALEIFVMAKTFVIMDWLRQQGVEGKSRVQAMTQMLGYELADEFFALINP